MAAAMKIDPAEFVPEAKVPIKIDLAEFKPEKQAIKIDASEFVPEQSTGILSDLATAGKEALGDVASVTDRALGYITGSGSYGLTGNADLLNRATGDVESDAAAADVAAGKSEFWGGVRRGAGRSLLEGAVMAPTGPYGMIAGATGIQANQAATEAMDAGLKGGDAARYVAEQAAMEALPAAIMQKVGLGGLEKQMSTAFKGGAKGLIGGIKEMAKDIGLELPEELVTSVGQKISSAKELEGRNPDEITADEWKSLIKGTVAQTALAGGVAGVPNLVQSATSGRPNTPTPDAPPTPYEPPFSDPDEAPITDLEQIKDIFAPEDAVVAQEAQPYKPDQMPAKQEIVAPEPIQTEPQATDEPQPESEVVTSEEEGQKAEVLNRDAWGEASQVQPPAPDAGQVATETVEPVDLNVETQIATPEANLAPAPDAAQSAVAPNPKRGIGMRRTSPEGSAMVEAAKQQLRDVINNPDIVGRQRGDMLENGRRLIQFLEANAANPEKMDTGYERGDKVAYTGEQVEPGFRSFIYLEGSNAGKEGVAVTPEQSAINIAKRQAEEKDQQEQFSRLNNAQKAAVKTAPPATGKVGADGWLFEKGKGYSKKVSGYGVEVLAHKNTQKDDKYEAVVNGSSVGRFGSASDAKAYVESNVSAWAEQDALDAANEEDAPRGPAPADTGIFRELTAAAREGKRFVEELYPRIQPVLARIHAQAKSAADFVKRAVAKIGQHVRPYAQRFLKTIRSERGAAINPFGPLARKVSQSKTQQASNDTFAQGIKQGMHLGGMRSRKELKEFMQRAKVALPAEQYGARLKVMNRILASNDRSVARKAERINRFLEATRQQTFKAQLVKGVAAQAKRLQGKMASMEPGLKLAVKEVLDSFSATKPTEATLNKAEALLTAIADGKEVGSPKAVEKAEKAIETFLGDKALASMPKDSLQRLKGVLEELSALHDGNLQQLKDAKKQRKEQYKQASAEVTSYIDKPYTGDEQERKGMARFLLRDVGYNVFNKVMSLAPEGSLLHRIAIKETDAGENRESAHRITARDYIMDGLSKLKGSDGKPLVERRPGDDSFNLHPEFERMSFMLSDYANKSSAGKAIARMRNKAPLLIRTPLANGNLYLTGAERARLYQLGLDPNARYQITRSNSEGIYIARKASEKIQKITPADFAAIEASLTPNERAIGKMMFDFDNGHVKDVVNEMSVKEFGRAIFAEDDKTSYRRYHHDKEANKFAEHIGKTFIENQGMLKDLTGGTSPIVLGDALTEYFSHQARVAAIVGRMVPSMRLRELAGTEAFREAVRKSSKKGANTLRDLERTFNSYGEMGGEQDTAMWMVNGILSRLASAWLGFNPKTIITTPMSVLSAQSRIPFRHLIANASLRTRSASVLSEMRQYAPKMYEMTTSSGFNVVSPESTGESAQKFFGKGARGHEKAQFFLHESNNIPALMIWSAAKDWGKAQGLSGEELMQFTAQHAQDAYSVSQPDNRWIYSSGAKLEARKSAAWRVATFLQGQTTKQYNQAAEALLRFSYTGKTTADTARLVKDMLVPTLGQALLYTAVSYALKAGYDEWDGLKGGEGKRLKGLTSGDFVFDLGTTFMEGNIPVVGSVAGDFARVVRKAAKGQSPDRAVNGSESVLGRPVALVYKMADAVVRFAKKPTRANGTKARKALVEAASVAGYNTDIINEVLDLVQGQ